MVEVVEVAEIIQYNNDGNGLQENTLLWHFFQCSP